MDDLDERIAAANDEFISEEEEAELSVIKLKPKKNPYYQIKA